jgi:dTDP-4-amino-4,6-dideoxygalactose transaminase
MLENINKPEIIDTKEQKSIDSVLLDFNRPAVTGNEQKNIEDVFKFIKFSGDGSFTKKCHTWFDNKLEGSKTLLTTSCTHALEMAAILLDIKEGDEVIMPSYTFVSTSNAFVLRGAKIIFIDVRPDTMNMDESKIEAAITDKTKAIVPVHYAGVGCDMDTIMEIADKYNLFVVEDAAQGMMATYNGRALGTIGHIGCFSFHETKNYQCGEGGLLILNDDKFFERAEIIREKGTNRSKFFRGQVDKYSWVDMGSSYLPSELNAAFLYGQLESADEINDNRLATWKGYYNGLKELEERGLIELPTIPKNTQHNAHMFYLKAKDLEERSALIKFLRADNIEAVFHYVPLHSSSAGEKFGEFRGEDKYTTSESNRLVRLPFCFNLLESEREKVINRIKLFYSR